VLRKIFGPKREWRRLHNEELHDLNTSSDTVVSKLKVVKWTGNVASVEVKRNGCIMWVGKSEGNRSFDET
jgi:hypothetical protein